MITQYKDVIHLRIWLSYLTLTTQQTKRKASGMFGIIRRNFKGLKNDTFLMLYIAMIRSHLK